MRRRTILGGAGLAGVAGLGTWAYRTAPNFWQQYSEDLKRGVLPAPHKPDPKSWGDRGIHAAWLGHTSVLLKIDGFTVLTDPVLGDRVGIDLGLFTLGIKRLIAPALRPSELPKIDLILLSHAHFDHFDIPTLRRLESRGTAVVTAKRTADLLRPHRYRGVTELPWGQRTQAGPLEIRAFEVNHWGARMRSDTYRGYNGYTLESGRYRILFGGDTAITTGFSAVRTSRPYDLAIMPVGAYNPWIHYHCTPEQAWQMTQDAGAEFFFPVHHQTFRLSREPSREPIERVYGCAGTHADRVAVNQVGQQIHIA
jgi:L-ascorbate metabolism protein UlaG (beta-lactamase superfamily)